MLVQPEPTTQFVAIDKKNKLGIYFLKTLLMLKQ